MGASNSTLCQSLSPPNTDPTPSMPMSDSPSKPLSPTEQPQLDPKSSEEPGAEVKSDEAVQPEIGEEEEDLFMKGGACKESFVASENCIEEAEKNKEDIDQKCSDLTSALRTCMVAHADYYEPILRAEKAAEEEAIKELDKEKAANKKEEHDKLEKKEEQDKQAEQEVVIQLEDEKKTPEASSEEKQ